MPAVHDDERDEHNGGRNEPERRGALPVENGDDEDGDDVVGHGERAQEHADAVGHAVAQKRHDAERERDVGGSGNAPAVSRVRVRRIEDEVDDDREEHAAERSYDGQQRLPDVRELAHRHLVLYLKAYEQEEHRHEDVVDNVGKRHLGRCLAEEKAHFGMPERIELIVERRVGDNEGDDGGQQHERRRLGRRVEQLDYPFVERLVSGDFLDEKRIFTGVFARIATRHMNPTVGLSAFWLICS